MDGPEAVSGPEVPAPLSDEAAAFEVVNEAGAAEALVICDHASRRLPAELGDLGLDDGLRRRHIAWDIGAADVVRRLALLLDAPALLSGYSRLVIDCNRRLGDPGSIMAVSDGIEVPGNRDLDEVHRAERAARYFWPYHRRIERFLGDFQARGITPTIVSVHSFTPIMDGFERPWHVGLVWQRDGGPAQRLVAELRRDPGLVVGDNEPYTGHGSRGYGLPVYGDERGLPMAMFEIRQDLIDTHHGAEAWAHRLHSALLEVGIAG